MRSLKYISLLSLLGVTVHGSKQLRSKLAQVNSQWGSETTTQSPSIGLASAITYAAPDLYTYDEQTNEFTYVTHTSPYIDTYYTYNPHTDSYIEYIPEANLDSANVPSCDTIPEAQIEYE